MSMRQQFMVANNVPGQDLVLSPLTGTSIKVIGVHVDDTVTGYATFEIGKTTVGYFRVDKDTGNHIPFLTYYNGTSFQNFMANSNLLQWMMSQTDFDGFPVGEGETFRIAANWGADSNVSVTYQIYDAADIKPSMPNGSQASIYHVLNYGEVSGGMPGAGLFTVNSSVTPVQFPSFPFGESCPSNVKISILGIAARNAQYVSGTANTYTTTQYLKMTRDRTVLFDEKKSGLRFYGGDNTAATTAQYGVAASMLGDNSFLDLRHPFTPPSPLIFNAGDELLVQIQCSAGATALLIPPGVVQISMIEKIEVKGG